MAKLIVDTHRTRSYTVNTKGNKVNTVIEIEILKQDLTICERELELAEKRVLELEALRRQLEYDYAEAERELEKNYA